MKKTDNASLSDSTVHEHISEVFGDDKDQNIAEMKAAPLSLLSIQID